MYSWTGINRKVPTALIILAILALIACDTEKGATGATGSDGMDGVDGTSCLATKSNDSLFINCSGVLDTIVNGSNGKNGENGSDGKNGADGTSCLATKNNDSLFVDCNGVLDTIVDGTDGSNGTSCTVTDDGAGTLTQTCTDGTSVSWPKALCGTQAYEPTKAFCQTTTIVEFLHTYTQSEITALGSALPTYCQTEGNCGQLGDARDGKIYRWTKIGAQTWMAENLAYLPSVNAKADNSATEARYYVYGYDDTNVASAKAQANYTTYGVLYNWTAIMAGSASRTASPSGVKGVCPAGWHLPSRAEWDTLVTYVGGSSTAGTKLKSVTGWASGGVTGTDAYGFSALPGGVYSGGSFNYALYWWTATEYDASGAYSRSMYYNYANVNSLINYKYYGFSARCLQD